MNQKLKDSFKEIYRSIIEHNPDAIFVLTVEGNIVEINQVFTKILGYSQEEVRERYFQDMIVPGQAEKFLQLFPQILQGQPFEDHFDALHKNGEILNLQIKCIPLTVKHEPVGIFGVAKDLTELQKAKNALITRTKQYQLLADNSLDLIQLVSLDGMVIYASPSHQSVLGYKPEEYVGKPVFYQPSGRIDEHFKKKFLKMIDTQKPFTCEITRWNKAGYEVWVELKGSLVLDEHGEFLHSMIVGREITERREYQKRLEYLSFHDPLTGMPNRRMFKGRLEQTLREAKRYHRKFAVIFMDIDHFKHINDTLGHDAGDELLKQFSKRVKSHLRESDTIARHGGDEFMILLPDIKEEEEAFGVANRILASLQEPWHICGQYFQTTSSMGISFYPGNGTNISLLMKRADKALYKAKNGGRNNVKVYSP